MPIDPELYNKIMGLLDGRPMSEALMALMKAHILVLMNVPDRDERMKVHRNISAKVGRILRELSTDKEGARKGKGKACPP